MVTASPLVWLHDKYKDRDWFHSVGTDQHNRYVVYVKYMNHDTLHDIPDYEGGVPVLVHFAASKLATRDQFVQKPGQISLKLLTDIKLETLPLPLVDEIVDVVGSVSGADTEDKTLRHLQNELDKLEKLCGTYTLNDIFYEIQDGKNAVTNMSSRYPEVRQRMEKLYDQYGFDVIYEELDG
jgi:hypothetical protein